MCNHIGPVNMIAFDWYINGTPGADVVGCPAPLIFDFWVDGCFGTLGSGLSLSLDLKCCSMLVCTPSVASILLEDESNTDVRLLSVGGEACIHELENKAQIFRNGYGPTECSIFASSSNKASTIGKPLPNVLCYVVHPDDGSLCPPGISGELWIGGVGVSLGYHNRPELTAEKFIANPFSSSGKVYKTGDRVKWNDEGELVYLGRFDHQVKVRGYRIELGEIQAELEKQAGVKGSLVLVHEDKIVAFVVSGGSNSNSAPAPALMEDNLMEALKSGPLTSYMVPWKIIVVDEFPLTANGKVDRKDLLNRFALMSAAQTEFVAPVTEEELQMIEAWQSVLEAEQAIGMNDNFFELGGHSLLAMKLAAVLGCGLDVIMSNPTPSSLVTSSRDGSSFKMEALIASLEEDTSMTKNEQRLLFIHLQDRRSKSYNMPFCVKFEDSVDLKTNLELVLDRIPSLRTRFENEKAIEDVKLAVADLTNDASINERQSMMCLPFDLEAGPLCRFGVDRENNMLYACIHHSIFDGKSVQVFLEAVAMGRAKSSTKLYNVRKYAAYEALPEVQEKYKASAVAWKDLLGDTPSRLEVDFGSSSLDEPSPTNSLVVDRATVARLQAFCRKEGVSMFVFALSILHHCMRAYSRDAYAIGTAYDGRPGAFSDAIGMFVNTVLVPFMGGKEGGTETLKELHTRWTNGTLPNATTPYDMVSSMGYGCNIYLAFNVGIMSESDISSASLFQTKNVEVPDESAAKFDLSVSWSESFTGDGSWEVSFESGIGQWPGLEDRFSQVMSGLLQGVEAQPSLTLLLPREKSQVLQWGQGAQQPIRQACLHEMFEKQARQHPENIALLDERGTKQMTYGELERQSNALAVELQRLGAKPNSFVGILMGERKFEMYVGVLGILKSGAAYVPMDAVLFPAERIKFIAEDTGMQLLVSVSEYDGLVKGLKLDCVEHVLVEDVARSLCNDERLKDCKPVRLVKPTDCAYMVSSKFYMFLILAVVHI